MKKLITIILLLVSLTLTAQSDKKVKRETITTPLNVMVSLPNLILTGDSARIEEKPMFCEYDEFAKFFISNRRIYTYVHNVKLDLRVKKKRVGPYKSWLAIDDEYNYYLVMRVTGIGENNGQGILFRPVRKDLTYDLNRLVYLISGSSELCK